MAKGTRADLIVLDMVGTTVRAGDEVPETFRGVLEAEGVTVSDADLLNVRGRSKREAIADLLRASGNAEGPHIDRVYRGFQQTLRRAYRSRAAEVPGAGEALRDLLGRVKVVLTTGLDRTTATQLVNALGWSDLGLAGVISGDDVERGRPAPDLIRMAMKKAGARDPARVVSVGDTISDLEAARRAEVGWSVGVLSGAHSRSQLEALPHSAILGSVVELPDWLLQVNALA